MDREKARKEISLDLPDIYAEGSLTVDENAVVTVNAPAFSSNADASISSYGAEIHGNLKVGKGAALICNGGEIEFKSKNNRDYAASYGLNVQDSNITVEGTLKCYGGSASATMSASSNGLFLIRGNLTVEKDGLLAASAGNATGQRIGNASMDFYGGRASCSFTVNGGKVMVSTAELTGDAIRANCYGIRLSATVTKVNDGSIEINTGSVESKYENFIYGIFIDGSSMTVKNSGNVTVTNGNTALTDAGYYAENYGIYNLESEIAVEDGTLSVTAGEVSSPSVTDSNGSIGIALCTDDSSISLKGGCINATGKSVKLGEAKAGVSIGIGSVCDVAQSPKGTVSILSGNAACTGETNGLLANSLSIGNGKDSADLKAISNNGEAIRATAEFTVADNLDIVVPVDGALSDGKAGYYTVLDGETAAQTARITQKVNVDGLTVFLDPFTCTGAEQAPAYKVVINGNTLTEGTDYTVIAEESDISKKDVGEYAIKLKGIGIYSGDITVKWSIEHSMTAATCTSKAKCSGCGYEYGELDSKNHSGLKRFPARAATSDAEGNTEYWYCENCGKYFGNKDGNNEIALADTVVARLPDSKSPATGDNCNLSLMLVLILASGAALLVFAAYGKKHFAK